MKDKTMRIRINSLENAAQMIRGIFEAGGFEEEHHEGTLQ